MYILALEDSEIESAIVVAAGAMVVRELEAFICTCDDHAAVPVVLLRL